MNNWFKTRQQRMLLTFDSCKIEGRKFDLIEAGKLFSFRDEAKSNDFIWTATIVGHFGVDYSIHFWSSWGGETLYAHEWGELICANNLFELIDAIYDKYEAAKPHQFTDELITE